MIWSGGRIPMKRTFWRDTAVAAALALGLATALLAADVKDAQKLPGTWLVEPLYFDLLVDQGVVVPEFPVLAIKPDGRFLLFRIFYACQPHDANGRELLRAENPARFDKICSVQREQIREYGFTHSYGQLNAAGRWQVGDDNRLRFAVESKGTTPEYFQKIVDAVRADLKGAGDIVGAYVRDPQTQKAAQARLDLQSARLAAFYTTFYIFDGAPQTYSIDGSFLRLAGAEPADSIVFRAYAPEVIDTATVVVATLGVSAAKYFRCVVDKIEQTQRQEAAAAAEFATFLKLARQYAQAQAPKADKKQLQALTAQLEAHPAVNAANTARLGAYLGCPKRDSL